MSCKTLTETSEIENNFPKNSKEIFKTLIEFHLYLLTCWTIDLQVSNHHSSHDGQINETQELKSLLDNADQRNQEQEQVFHSIKHRPSQSYFISFLENCSIGKSNSTIYCSDQYLRRSFACMLNNRIFSLILLHFTISDKWRE